MRFITQLLAGAKHRSSFATSQICQEVDVSHGLINVPSSTSEFVIYFNSQASNIQRCTHDHPQTAASQSSVGECSAEL